MKNVDSSLNACFGECAKKFIGKNKDFELDLQECQADCILNADDGEARTIVEDNVASILDCTDKCATEADKVRS